MLPGISADGCSPDGYSSRQEEHKETAEKKASSKVFVVVSLQETKAPFTLDFLGNSPPMARPDGCAAATSLVPL